MADTIASLAAELAAMPDRDRRAILRALSRAERAALEQAAAVHPDAEDAPESNGFSAMLASRIAAARADQPEGAPAPITPAARRALLAAIGEDAPAASAPGTASGRSLFDAFGQMLSPRRARP